MIDQIVAFEPGVRISATKRLRAEEDYLLDHFPQFPVMPGVLMLEAMFQASMWLVRASEGFAHGAVILKEARNIKYADFVEPGEVLCITAEILKQDARNTTIKAEGSVDGKIAVSGRLILERFDRAAEAPLFAQGDLRARVEMRCEFQRLCQVAA